MYNTNIIQLIEYRKLYILENINKFNILKMFIENILGTESKIKIIRTLLEINTAFTLEDLEQETLLSRGIIHREIKRLEKDNIIQKVEKKGKLGFYKINLNNNYSQLLAKLFDLEKLQERQNKIPLVTWNLLSLIVNKIIANNLKIKKIILYGSVARGTSTIHSDIDLLIVAKNYFKELLKLSDIIEGFIEKRKINIDIIAEDKFNKDKTDLIREIKKEGVVLYG